MVYNVVFCQNLSEKHRNKHNFQYYVSHMAIHFNGCTNHKYILFTDERK